MLIFTTVWMILQGLTQIRILNSLMFPKEVRWFHEWIIMLRFYVFLCSLESWSLDLSLWWPPKKLKQKIMTEITKNSLGNLATHGKVLFLLPPNNFLTKKNEFSSISYASFEATGIVHVIPLSLRYWGPSSIYRRGYIYLENGITLNYQNQWLEIYSYDYFILSDQLVL